MPSCPPYSPPPEPPDPPSIYPMLPPSAPAMAQGNFSPVVAALRTPDFESVTAFPVIRGTPAVGAEGAAGYVPAVPDHYGPVAYQIVKELQRSVRENGAQAPYTQPCFFF